MPHSSLNTRLRIAALLRSLQGSICCWLSAPLAIQQQAPTAPAGVGLQLHTSLAGPACDGGGAAASASTGREFQTAAVKRPSISLPPPALASLPTRCCSFQVRQAQLWEALPAAHDDLLRVPGAPSSCRRRCTPAACICGSRQLALNSPVHCPLHPPVAPAVIVVAMAAAVGSYCLLICLAQKIGRRTDSGADAPAAVAHRAAGPDSAAAADGSAHGAQGRCGWVAMPAGSHGGRTLQGRSWELAVAALAGRPISLRPASEPPSRCDPTRLAHRCELPCTARAGGCAGSGWQGDCGECAGTGKQACSLPCLLLHGRSGRASTAKHTSIQLADCICGLRMSCMLSSTSVPLLCPPPAGVPAAREQPIVPGHSEGGGGWQVRAAVWERSSAERDVVHLAQHAEAAHAALCAATGRSNET